MSLINTKIKPFKNQAFKNGEFIEITEKDTEGRWSVFFFYPADFTFVCLTRNFDNMREDEGLADRATFVVDPQGIIQAIEVTAEGIGRDASDLLRKIKAAQYVASHPGEVCPAKWKEGEATLAPSLDLVGKI